MRVALINAHTSYAQGASGLVDNVLQTEYKLSTKINKDIKLVLDRYSINNYIVDGSEVKPYNKSLHYKAFFVNADQNTDLVVETHFNSAFNKALAPYSSGFEVLYGEKPDSKEFAVCMVEELKKHLPFKVRRGGTGLYNRNRLYLFRHIDLPVIMVEVCFLTHYKDRLFLIHPRSTEIIANGITNGILSYGKQRGLMDDG